MVTIRLARHGGKKKPFYHITVAERSARRDGRFVERVGFYNPVARGGEAELRVDLQRVEHWLNVGAQPTARVRQLVTAWRKLTAAAAAETAETAAAEAAETAVSATAEAAEPPAATA